MANLQRSRKMPHVPAELLDTICSDIDDIKSLKSFRLVCRRFEAVGLRHLFVKVDVALTEESLDRLEKIATNAGVHVKHLIIRPQIIRDLRTTGYDLWIQQEEVDRRTRVRGISPQKWERCLQLRAEQMSLLDSGKGGRIIAESVKKLKNLFGVTIKADLEYWQFQSGLVYSLLPWWNFDSAATHNRAGVDVFRALLTSLDTDYIHRKLRFLDFKTMDWRFFDPTCIAPHSFKTSFQTLVNVRLSYANYQGIRYEDHDDSHERPDDSLVGAFVAAAKDLQILDFKVPDDPWSLDKIYFSTEMLFGNNFWPKLSELTISGVRIHAGQFLEFLIRHEGVLAKLTLGESWGKLLLSFPGERNPWFSFLRRIATMRVIPSFCLEARMVLCSRVGLLTERRPIEGYGSLTPFRGVRYLVCGRTTNERDREDGITADPRIDWSKLSWDDIRCDI